MRQLAIPLPSAGIDNRTQLTALRSGSAREVENVILRSSGAFARRDGFDIRLTGTDFHSVHTDEWGTLVVGDTRLYDCSQDFHLTPLYDTGTAAPVDLIGYNGRSYILTQRELLVRDSSGVRAAGVETPTLLPALSDAGPGNLHLGKYGVAISAVDVNGEESGAAWAGTINSSGSVTLTGFGPGAHRIYCTTADGDQLYHAIDTLPGQASAQITHMPEGAPCATLHLQRLPGGHTVRARAGRIYIAHGDLVIFSQPLRPHLFDPRSDFIPVVGTVSLIEPVGGGVFIGDSRGVWFLRGDDPSDSQLGRVSDAVAVKGSSTQLPASALGLEGEDMVAVWLSADGYVVGTPDGNTIRLQGQRTALIDGMSGSTAVINFGGDTQLVTLTAAHRPLQTPRANPDRL